MGWTEFVAAFIVFFISHSVPVRPPVKPWLVSKVGAGAFTALYSLLSLVILAWLIAAAGRAPYIELWGWAEWQSWVAVTIMGIACLLFAVTAGRPNPLSFGGGNNQAFDPDRPGIVRWIRHPLLIVLALWASAHLIVNGDLAHVILFGVFVLFAVLGRKLVDRRKKRELGEEWDSMVARISAAPLVTAPQSPTGLVFRLVAAVIAFYSLISLHGWIIGVEPLPI
ncbi:MAG: NnrU family protein [Stappiaceae bacterium]